METKSASLPWEQGDFESTSWEDFTPEVSRGRQATQRTQPSSRSRRAEARPQYASSPQQQQHDLSSPVLEQVMHRMPSSEPTYHEVDQNYHSRSLSPARRRRAKVEAARPSMQRDDSIDRLVERFAAASSGKQDLDTSRDALSPLPATPLDSLVMYSDPVDVDSVLTGWSQQELLKRKEKDNERRRRKYSKKKAHKEPRILNISSIRAASPSRRKYARGLEEESNATDERSQASRTRLLSRYGSARRRTVPLAPAACAGDVRKRNWKIMSSFSRSSEEEMDSTQSSHDTAPEVPEVDNTVTYASIPINPAEATKTNQDIRAQAAEEWLRSGMAAPATPVLEEKDEEDNHKDDVEQASLHNDDEEEASPYDERFRVLETTASTSDVSEEAVSREDNGAFPTLNDSRISWDADRGDVAFDELMDRQTDNNKSSPPRGVGGLRRGPVIVGEGWEHSDKMSEESPVSVISLGRFSQVISTKPKGMPAAAGAAAVSKRPQSILRTGGQSRDKDEKKSVQFRGVDEYFYDDSDSQQFSEQSSECSTMENAAEAAPSSSDAQVHGDEGNDFENWHEPTHVSSKDFHDEPSTEDEDQGWGHDFYNSESETELGSTLSEGANSVFIEMVASIVIQTAVRRMLAFKAVERILMQDSTPEESIEEDEAVAERIVSVPSRPERELEVKAVERTAAVTSPSQGEGFEIVSHDSHDLAAIRIQSLFRAWWIRDLLAVDHFCATRIQRVYRGYHDRMSFLFDVYRIIIVQSLWRRRIAEIVAWKRLIPVIVIQSAYRGYRQRKQLDMGNGMARQTSEQDFSYEEDSILEHAAATAIQTQWRAYDARMWFLELFEEGDSALEEAAATAIQTQWRSYDANMWYLHSVASILILQSVARRWLAKRRALAVARQNVLKKRRAAFHNLLKQSRTRVTEGYEVHSQSSSRAERSRTSASTPGQRTPCESLPAQSTLEKAKRVTGIPERLERIQQRVENIENERRKKADSQQVEAEVAAQETHEEDAQPMDEIQNGDNDTSNDLHCPGGEENAPPPAQENEDVLTLEKIQAEKNRERSKSKMSGSAASFWKAMDKQTGGDSATKALYRRKDMQQHVAKETE